MSTTETVSKLVSGMRLTRDEFLRHCEAWPELEDVELIGGVVHIPQYVTAIHGDFHCLFSGWLGIYMFDTPGIKGLSRASWIMNEWNVSQPDISYIILPEYGGQLKKDKGIAVGAPALILEVSDEGAKVELGEKFKLYENVGVQEYIVADAESQKIYWFHLHNGKYQPLEPGEDGVYRSKLFPGLWLDVDALYQHATKRFREIIQAGLQSSEHIEFVELLQSRKR